jgi:hypothetical protein
VLVIPEADPEPVPAKVSPGKPTPVTPKPEMLDPF